MINIEEETVVSVMGPILFIYEIEQTMLVVKRKENICVRWKN